MVCAHVTLEIIEQAKKVGLDLLTLPIHILHELQPLDVSVFKPFKIAFRKLQDIWSLANKHCGKIGQLKATKGTTEVVKLERTQKKIAKKVFNE